MEELIRQAFLHVEVIGPHVAEGHYDLVGPNGDIILPQVWETVIEPDWTITMHMWPIPEKPKDSEPPAPTSVPEDENAIIAIVEDPKKRPDGAGMLSVFILLGRSFSLPYYRTVIDSLLKQLQSQRDHGLGGRIQGHLQCG
jgi:hypothetical protein